MQQQQAMCCVGHLKTCDLSLLARQEVSSSTSQGQGEVPRTLEVELSRDLVDCCVAGDVVTVLGLVKVICTEATAGVLQSRPGGQCEVCDGRACPRWLVSVGDCQVLLSTEGLMAVTGHSEIISRQLQLCPCSS